MQTFQETNVITAVQLTHLPAIVQQYLAFSGVVGHAWIATARVKQVGRFRQGLARPWLPITAVQTFTTNPPGFIWDAKFKVVGLPLVRARDAYQDGHGHMLGQVASLYTLFDERGDKLDQGAMLRYLTEMLWFPTAYVGHRITWEYRDEQSAQVTFSDGGRSVSGQLFFESDGRPLRFTTHRYALQPDGDYRLQPWTAVCTDYATWHGLTIPVRGQVVWNLSTGDLPYFDWTVTAVEYSF